MFFDLEIPPMAALGVWDLWLWQGQYNATLMQAFTIYPRVAPNVTSISPSKGIIGSKFNVTFIGEGFWGAPRVYLKRIGQTSIRAISVDVTSWNSFSCTIAIPMSAALGLWDLFISQAEFNKTWTNAFTIYPQVAPNLTSISPSQGVVGQSYSSLIAGEGFWGTVMVQLTMSGQSPINATNVSVVSWNQISCMISIPLNAVLGQWKVVVINGAGQASTSPLFFTIASSPSPLSLSSITPNSGLRGATISITNLAGNGFMGTPIVRLTMINQFRFYKN